MHAHHGSSIDPRDLKGSKQMNDATLQHFRNLADAMGCGQNKDWTICVRHTMTDGSERLLVKAFGYTKERAEDGAKYYRGGIAVHESELLKSK